MDEIRNQIFEMAKKYRDTLGGQIKKRHQEMEEDDNSHYLIYNVLGISDAEGLNIDLYQNAGRFLYKYAGSLLEEAAIKCLQYRFPSGQAKVKLKNTIDNSPKTVEIDFLYNNEACEIKWRDATTDGDHIKKEEKRIQVIYEKGYTPIRVMFYKPNRGQAIKIQGKLKKIYESYSGHYYSGEEAWDFIKSTTGVDLKEIFVTIINDKQN